MKAIQKSFLPVQLVLFAVPLSLLEAYLAAWIIHKLSLVEN
jgi:hypothetical protein